MRIVLDTNILVSASFWNGDSARIVALVAEEQIICFTSKEMIEEYKKVILRDFKIPEQSFNERLLCLLKIATIIQTTKKVFLCEDADDNKVLEVALETKSDYVVSADKHLLKLKECCRAKIVTPKEFLEIFSTNKV